MLLERHVPHKVGVVVMLIFIEVAWCGDCRVVLVVWGLPLIFHTGDGRGRKNVLHPGTSRCSMGRMSLCLKMPNRFPTSVAWAQIISLSLLETSGASLVTRPGGASVRGGLVFEESAVGDVHLGRRAQGLDVLLHGVVHREIGDLDVVPVDEVLGDLPGHVDAGGVGGGSACSGGASVGTGEDAADVSWPILMLRSGAFCSTLPVVVCFHFGEDRQVQLEVRGWQEKLLVVVVAVVVLPVIPDQCMRCSSPKAGFPQVPTFTVKSVSGSTRWLAAWWFTSR